MNDKNGINQWILVLIWKGMKFSLSWNGNNYLGTMMCKIWLSLRNCLQNLVRVVSLGCRSVFGCRLVLCYWNNCSNCSLDLVPPTWKHWYSFSPNQSSLPILVDVCECEWSKICAFLLEFSQYFTMFFFWLALVDLYL